LWLRKRETERERDFRQKTRKGRGKERELTCNMRNDFIAITVVTKFQRHEEGVFGGELATEEDV